jgi:O-succinylhomoserine sulfhydrylase
MAKELQVSTKGVRAGILRTEFAEHSEALFLTSSFVFDNAAQAAGALREQRGRDGVLALHQSHGLHVPGPLAAMEGAETCVATASGMAAILATAMVHLKSGDHVVCSNAVFGATIQLFNNILGRFGIETSYVSPTRPQEWERAVRKEHPPVLPRDAFQPMTEVSDISALAGIAKRRERCLPSTTCSAPRRCRSRSSLARTSWCIPRPSTSTGRDG